MNTMRMDREALPEAPNPLGLAGIEFIEYATSKPQALGALLETMGFKPVARHRSREVVLYRQAGMNLLVNASPDDARGSASDGDKPAISALAFRVRDARKAHARCVELGAWEVPVHAEAMELNIPAIHGPGGSRIYFVDRHQDFSIYDIDFFPIPGVEAQPASLTDLDFFGLVQYVGMNRSNEWIAFYEALFGFVVLPDELRFGIMPKGTLLRSPCGGFMWQLVEPDPEVELDDTPESLRRIGLGTHDVPAAVAALRARGVEFVDSERLHPQDRGALTGTLLGSVAFELVHRSA
jgi:4-hydroxyphenylpyruvate dioxygenase